jgi:hypothetical protein
MPAAARPSPYLTAGMALAGASLIAITPMAPPPANVHVANPAVRLLSGGESLLNIPYNLFADMVNIPYVLLEAPYSVKGLIPNTAADVAGQHVPGSGLAADGTIDQPSDVWPLYYGPFDNFDPSGNSDDYIFHGALNFLAAALNYTGSYYVSNPTNVFRWDTGNPWNFQSVVDVLLPFKDLGPSVAHNLNIIAEAEFPEASALNAYFFYDALGELGTLFKVPFSTLVDGYTLPPDTALNPVGAGNGPLGAPLEAGLPYHEIWSGQHVQLDPTLGFGDFFKSLMQDPSENPIHFVDLSTILPTYAHLQQGINIDFNPFEPGMAGFFFQAAQYVYGIPALINGIFNGPHGLMPGAPDIIPDSVTQYLGNALDSIIGPGTPLAQTLIGLGQLFNEFINAFTDYPQPPALNDPLPPDLPIADDFPAVTPDLPDVVDLPF